ncbi:winged helix-turn-helix domain-containing protein [Antarcticimicrobium sediminis]|uniref:Response regulator transcription factor n=1 Tax=Antarcticimicrobium sediminis TaxID=2546227 RepID=A0A4R5EVH0_9RHOB|nr:winged helix-turn-helix domain-containing protein [Antarcticimicrobium sediminis]TDE38873.1 response regulator transcription factor [Antarcticimicrobium sediminis]
MADARISDPHQPFALIVEVDMATRIALDHLFSVILHRPVRASADCDEARALLEQGLRPQVLIAGRGKTPAAALALIRVAAAQRPAPFIFALDWRDRPDTGVQAFLAGADDVVCAPVPLKEFALRLRARLGSEACGLTASKADLRADWDAEADIVCRAGLTGAEAQVVNILLSHSGEIVTRDALSRAIDQRPWAYGDRKFDVHVAKIRKKLDGVFGPRISVRTVRASGYVMTLDEAIPLASGASGPAS